MKFLVAVRFARDGSVCYRNQHPRGSHDPLPFTNVRAEAKPQSKCEADWLRHCFRPPNWECLVEPWEESP